MTTLDDFRETLTGDPADWLVLADWLEESGDELAIGVRTVANRGSVLASAVQTPKEFLKDYLFQVEFFGRCRPFNWPNSSWFDVVTALAQARVNADASHERFLDSLEDKLRQLTLTYRETLLAGLHAESREVARMVFDGLNRKEISQQLDIQLHSVVFELEWIMSKSRYINIHIWAILN